MKSSHEGRVLVATMRLPVAVRQLPVLVEWLERAYGRGLMMKQDGEFLCFMRPMVGEGEVGSGQLAVETAAGNAAGTGPEGEGKVFRGGVVGELPDGTKVIRGGIVGGEG